MKNKIYVSIFVLAMIILSFVVAFIMTGHYQEDTSKVRYQLTQDYKKFKDLEYSYDNTKGKLLFEGMCINCHFPNSVKAPEFNNHSLAQTEDLLMEISIRGMVGPIKRGHLQYNGSMSSYRKVSHTDLAYVLGYIQKNFYQKQPSITPVKIIDKKIEALLKEGPYKEQ